MKSFTTFNIQYAHRFYNFKGEAQYLHGHTGILTIEVEDTELFEDLDEVIDIIEFNQSEDYFEVDNNCPYYAEHKLIEWNKDES